MFRRPGLWLIHCSRCGAWFGLRGHTVRDCYTRFPYSKQWEQIRAEQLRRIGKDKDR